MRLAGYIITLNEEDHIRRSAASLLAVCDTVLVVDSGSGDATVEIARELGCEVVHHVFEGFSTQRNFAVDELVRRHNPEFVIALDADEWLDSDLEELDHPGQGGIRAVSFGQVGQPHVPAGPVKDRGDGGGAGGADDEVAFEMSDLGPGLSDRWPRSDRPVRPERRFGRWLLAFGIRRLRHRRRRCRPA